MNLSLSITKTKTGISIKAIDLEKRISTGNIKYSNKQIKEAGVLSVLYHANKLLEGAKEAMNKIEK